MNLARRSVTSSIYNIVANVFSIVSGIAGSILLARLLEPEAFGLFAFVSSTVNLAVALPAFGFPAAFMHKTGGENGMNEEILRVYFTLRLISASIWVVGMGVAVALFAPEHSRLIFAILIGAAFVSQQTTTIDVMLTRRVQFQRLAIMQAVVAVTSTAVSVALAWQGWGVWALLAGKITSVLVELVILYGIRPVWRPHLGWSKELVSYFLRFGSQVFGTSLLMQMLDRVDDIWTGVVLGDRALGFYDKAFGFAVYPRQVLAVPITQVAAGTFAQLRDDRARLSRTFFLINILMVRANFVVAALMWLVAPEFIHLVIGDKWLPMLATFRLMLAYALFDPIKGMIGSLLVLSGAPKKVIRTRIIQLLVMITGLVTLGPRLGIVGVAAAVDVMLVVGIVIFYHDARQFVDFSLLRFFTIPTLAMGLGLLFVQGVQRWFDIGGSTWLAASVKISVFVLTYAAVLILVEWALLKEMFATLLGSMREGVKHHD
jgi:O-antigen/teichoic acid export membrane protein